MTLDLFMNTGAEFSPCGQFRYRLWRIWDADKPFVLFLMLNPSVADETTNDPTVERCERRARQMGFGGLEVCNLFAYRATDPDDMLSQKDPVGEGEQNDRAILDVAGQAGLIVCAWGAHGSHKNRSAQVVQMLCQAGFPLFCLDTTDKGEPRHPLYIGYDRQPRLWR